jgi:hypothetical protein
MEGEPKIITFRKSDKLLIGQESIPAERLSYVLIEVLKRSRGKFEEACTIDNCDEKVRIINEALDLEACVNRLSAEYFKVVQEAETITLKCSQDENI